MLITVRSSVLCGWEERGKRRLAPTIGTRAAQRPRRAGNSKRRLRADSGVRAPDPGACVGVGIERELSRQR